MTILRTGNGLHLMAYENPRTIQRREQGRRWRQTPNGRESCKRKKQHFQVTHPDYNRRYKRTWSWWRKWGYIPLPHIQFSEFSTEVQYEEVYR